MAVARRRLSLVAPATLRGELWRRGLGFAVCRRDGMLRVDADGRRVYVEERPAGPAGRPTWIVHADGDLGEAPQQRVCTTPEEVVGLIVRAAA